MRRGGASLLVLLVVWTFNVGAMPAFKEVKSGFRPSDTLILDRHGELLQRLRTDASVRRGQWIALPEISPALRTALVLSEDKRFYEHSGVDWQAVSAAAWGNLWNSKTRGASTITMQLAGLLDDDLKRLRGQRSLLQKLDQSVSAATLERHWRKDQILEAYLNLVPFRGELVGIDALSRTLFGKAAHGLDQDEAALAAALVRAPNAKPEQVARRACSVRALMQGSALASPMTKSAVVGCDGVALMVSGALQRRSFEVSEGVAPHAARYVLRDLKGRVSGAPLRTTLRADLQRVAVQALQQHLRELRGHQVEDGALLVLDNASGQVLAWVGSSGSLSGAADVDGVTALRQPGSTLKPFLYAQAIAERRLTAASLLEDASTQIQTADGLYIPQNYDRHFKGWVSARTALGASLNVPAVRTLAMVSPDAFQRKLMMLGMPVREAGDYYGLSLALGSADVSLLNLTNAYRVLANSGRYGATSLTHQPAAPERQVLDAGAAFIVSDILSDPMARARTFDTDSVLRTRFWSAVKTGTSKDMRDNWAIGYSQVYTVGVWVGNASGAPMSDVSGITGAAPIWATVMNHLHRTQPSRAPQPPPGVVPHPVRFSMGKGETPVEAGRTEWFLRGTQQALFFVNKGAGLESPRSGRAGAVAARATVPRITEPSPGTIIALDPDIPPRRQLLSFSAGQDDVRWTMDGKEFARGATAKWAPWPGFHTVHLCGPGGEKFDEVRFEVRGAVAARRAPPDRDTTHQAADCQPPPRQ